MHFLIRLKKKIPGINSLAVTESFSLTRSAAMQIDWNKRQKNRCNSPRIAEEHQRSRRFIVLVHEYGGRDVI